VGEEEEITLENKNKNQIKKQNNNSLKSNQERTTMIISIVLFCGA
jgi:hypothetical protein